MATGEIYHIEVTYDQKSGGKQRYTVEVAKKGLGVVVLDNITSQYHHKSNFIKAQYYPIQDWLQAGLKKPSWVDIKSGRAYDLNDIMRHGRYIGQLTFRDVQALEQFIKSYRSRLAALRKK